MAPSPVKDVLLETVALWTKVRNLLKPGTFKRQAIMTAISRKGLWQSCQDPGYTKQHDQ
jgi:hypothetical protein